MGVSRPSNAQLSINCRVLIYCTCHFQGVPSSLFILASSVCKSLQCLISALTQEGKGGHLFRLTCSVVLCVGMDTGHTHQGPRIKRDTCTPMFIAALFTIARTWKQPRCSSADKWIRKLYVYTMEYYSAIKKDTFESVLMRWMKLEPIIQSEVSQKEKHQYIY